MLVIQICEFHKEVVFVCLVNHCGGFDWLDRIDLVL